MWLFHEKGLMMQHRKLRSPNAHEKKQDRGRRPRVANAVPRVRDGPRRSAADARSCPDGAGSDAQPVEFHSRDLRLPRHVGRLRDVHERDPLLRQADLRPSRKSRFMVSPPRSRRRLVGLSPFRTSRTSGARAGGAAASIQGSMIARMSGHYATLLRGTVTRRRRRDFISPTSDRCPRRAAGLRRVRPRRLHRLSHRHDRAPELRRRADRGDGGLPARRASRPWRRRR